MHELTLTRYTVEAVIELSEQANASKVKCAYFSIGSGRDIVEPLFRKIFEHLARGTIAEDCELVVNDVPLAVQCKVCERIYPVDPLDEKTWACSECNARDYTLHSGMEFTLDRIEVV